jgi:4-hydroxy-tetrahydrodipicolinate reductase
MGLGENVELTHRVRSRETFAQGTVFAIRFVAKVPAGLYSMMDVLWPPAESKP